MIAFAFVGGFAFCIVLFVALGWFATWEEDKRHREKVERNRRDYGD